MGCGWCCLDNPCEESHLLHGYTRRCPELLWDHAAKRYWWGLMQHERTKGTAKTNLFAGHGCCARDNPFRLNVKNRG